MCKRKLHEISAFGKVINGKILEVETVLKQMTFLFEASFFDKKTKAGVLRQHKSMYTDCFKFEFDRLKDVIGVDSDEWRKEIDMA